MADHGFPIASRSEDWVKHLAKTGFTPSTGEWDLFFHTFKKDLLTENPPIAFFWDDLEFFRVV
jgi:hypothetical protein